MTNGPCWVSTSFVLFLALHFLCAQAFNHLLLLFLFSNLKLTTACSKATHVITLEVRFLFLQWSKIPRTESGSQRPDIFGSPQRSSDPLVYMIKEDKDFHRGFLIFQRYSPWSIRLQKKKKSNFQSEPKPHLAVKSQNIFNW